MKRVYAFVNPSLYTLNLGSGQTDIGSVTVDVDRNHIPHVVADARFLPFKPGVFDQVIFADTIEHVPAGSEERALSEIRDVLRPGGWLILSTPNGRLAYTLLDPAYYFSNHRYYNMTRLLHMIADAGFDVANAFTAGGKFTCIDNFFAMTTRSSKGVRRDWLLKRVESEYSLNMGTRGYTIFVLAKIHDD